MAPITGARSDIDLCMVSAHTADPARQRFLTQI